MNIYVGYTLLAILVVAILAGIVALMSSSLKPTLPTNPNDCPNVLLRKGKRLLLMNTQKPKVEGLNPMYFNNLDDYVAYAKQHNTISGQTCPLLFLQQDDDEDEDEDEDEEEMPKRAPRPRQAAPRPAPKREPRPAAPRPMPKREPRLAAPMPAPMSTTEVPPVPRSLPNPVPPQPAGQSVTFPFPPTAVQPYIPPTLPTKKSSSSLPEFTQRTPAPYVDASRDDAPFNQNLYPGFDPMNLYAGVYTTVDAVHYSTRGTTPSTPFSDNAMDPNWGGVQYTRAQINSGKYDENMVDTVQYSAPPNTFMIPTMRPLVDPAAGPATQAPLTTLLP